MIKLGKKGKLNIKANKKIKKLFIEHGIRFCEVGLKGCTPDYGLTIAHKHKRIYYADKMELLYNIDEVILCCLNCHMQIEKDSQLTKDIFKKVMIGRSMDIIRASDEILDEVE